MSALDRVLGRGLRALCCCTHPGPVLDTLDLVRQLSPGQHSVPALPANSRRGLLDAGRYAVAVKRAAAWVLALLVVGGCAAPVGDTKLNLHQRARFSDGATYVLDGFEMSSKDSQRSARLTQPVSDDVTVWVKVSNPQSPVRADDVAMTFAYTDDRNVEIEPPQVGTSTNEITPGSSGRISKTFRVQQVSPLFRSRHLRVELAVPNYPIITFSGKNP